MVSAGWVPAEVAGMSLAWVQRAAASWERAVLAVQTNTTRVTGWTVDGRSPSRTAGTRWT